MSEIVITHTPADGTLAEGTEKGDGSAPILRRHGFDWGRSIGCWYIRNSRDRAPRLVAIEAAAEALRAEGHTVAVDVSSEVRDNQAANADRHERLEGRRAALTAKGEKLAAQSDALHRASDAMVEHLPLGQPVAPGRRGQAHRRLLERSVDTAIKAAQVGDEARRMPARITGSRRAEAYRERPDVTARRVARLEAELRSLDRRMASLRQHPETQSGTLLRQYEGERAVLVERIIGDRAVLDQARAEGTFGRYSKANVHKGDLVRIRGQWRTVARANTKSVSVETGYSWTDRYGYEEIRDVNCVHSAQD